MDSRIWVSSKAGARLCKPDGDCRTDMFPTLAFQTRDGTEALILSAAESACSADSSQLNPLFSGNCGQPTLYLLPGESWDPVIG